MQIIHLFQVASGCFTPDSKYAIIGDKFGDVSIMPVQGKPSELAPLLGHYCATITTLAVAATGRYRPLQMAWWSCVAAFPDEARVQPVCAGCLLLGTETANSGSAFFQMTPYMGAGRSSRTVCYIPQPSPALPSVAQALTRKRFSCPVH